VKEKLRVTITQEDIDLGMPRTSWACAVSYALQRMFPQYEISVIPQMGGHVVLLYEMQGSIQPDHVLVARYQLSANASKWINKFDHQEHGPGKDIEPATFEMTLIP
jgi:hypothetical protein